MLDKRVLFIKTNKIPERRKKGAQQQISTLLSLTRMEVITSKKLQVRKVRK
jgi:hypothetical protein